MTDVFMKRGNLEKDLHMTTPCEMKAEFFKPRDAKDGQQASSSWERGQD